MTTISEQIKTFFDNCERTPIYPDQIIVHPRIYALFEFTERASKAKRTKQMWKALRVSKYRNLEPHHIINEEIQGNFNDLFKVEWQ